MGLVHEVAGGSDLHVHVGEHERHGLELDDGAAELLPLFGVGESEVERSLSDPESLCPDPRPRAVEGHHGDAHALTLFADEVGGRYPHLIEEQLPGG